MVPRSASIAIVGAGIAGAATAWALARRGERGVVLLEQERSGDQHATGRNAAILRTAMPDAVLHALARESKRFYAAPPPEFAGEPLLRRTGLFLGATEAAAEAHLAWTGDPECVDGAVCVDPATVQRAVPALADGLAAVVHQPDEGVLDVHAIHQGFLRGARAGGVAFEKETVAIELLVEGGRVRGLETDRGTLHADQVVVAGGGWAARLPGAAGYGLPVRATRRHLLTTDPLPAVRPDWPVVWIAGDEYYFRPESGGLLMSACDQVDVEPEAGERVDEGVLDALAEKTARWLPSFSDAGAAHLWAGMRTFAPDQRFVLGPDPRLPGLAWAAGLGGHGITCAPAVGRLTAAWILGDDQAPELRQALSPGRLRPEPRVGGGVPA